ncbi:MAG: hypothetical protein KDD42_05055 [Bdellovibrionales bacterium]|nr:hypothetical protein [Bdellovibrionales bacterium]
MSSVRADFEEFKKRVSKSRQDNSISSTKHSGTIMLRKSAKSEELLE